MSFLLNKLPKSIKILDRRIKVRKVANLEDYAEMDYEKGIISIRRDLNIDLQIRAIFHELIEYLSADRGWGMDRRWNDRLFVLEHRDIDLLAISIVEALRSAEY